MNVVAFAACAAARVGNVVAFVALAAARGIKAVVSA